MFKIGRRNRRKKRIFRTFRILKKNRNSRTKKNNNKSKLKEAIERVNTSNQLDIINKQNKDKSFYKYLNDSNLATYGYSSENKAAHMAATDNSIDENTRRIKIKAKDKENREYVEKVRNQVKEVLEEKYDESFDNLFNEFEKSGFINRENFLFRLIFMILKKYDFIDIFDENGEIDPNAIDTILKSVVKDAYIMICSDENNNEYKCHCIEETCNDYNGNTYDDSFYEDE